MDPESDNEMDLALAHLAAEGEGHRLSVLNPRYSMQGAGVVGRGHCAVPELVGRHACDLSSGAYT